MIHIHGQIQFVTQTTPTRPAFALTILTLIKRNYTSIKGFYTRLIFKVWNHLIGAGSFKSRLFAENELTL
jgi:hypothetical protein